MRGRFVGFWAPFLCGVKAQIVRAHLSHLFKWRGVRLGKSECAHFVRNIAAKRERERERERENEKKSLCDISSQNFKH